MKESVTQISDKKNKALRHEQVVVKIPTTVWSEIQRGARKRGLNEEQFITLLLTNLEQSKPLTASEVIRLPKKKRERVLKTAVNKIASDYGKDEVLNDTQELVEY